MAFTVVGVAMIAQDLLARGAPAMPSAVLLVAVAAAIKTWATRPLLAAGPSLWWLSTAAQGGIVAAAVALLLAGWLAPKPRMLVAFASIAAATVLFNLAPPNAYHASMLAQWDPGAWVNFNALVRAVAVVWPFAALGWCAWRLRALARRPALYNRRA